MALDGPYTLEDLIKMKGGKKSASAKNEWLLHASAIHQKAHTQGTMRLIGIDPGTRFVGWGVVDYDSRTRALTLVDCGCIAPGEKKDLKDRLHLIFEDLEEILNRTKPGFAALEETFAGVNMKSAIAMGEGRGIALLALARCGLPILELSPRSVKQAVAGSGAATKARVAQMVAACLNVKKIPGSEDVTDALAVALALAQRL